MGIVIMTAGMEDAPFARVVRKLVQRVEMDANTRPHASGQVVVILGVCGNVAVIFAVASEQVEPIGEGDEGVPRAEGGDAAMRAVARDEPDG